MLAVYFLGGRDAGGSSNSSPANFTPQPCSTSAIGCKRTKRHLGIKHLDIDCCQTLYITTSTINVGLIASETTMVDGKELKEDWR